jgi:cystathionine beta-lyase/cystathionine gamma-synthase
VPPLEWSVVYKFDDLDHVDAVYAAEKPGYVYARDGHPNATRLASQIALLENAEAGIVTASGMGAEAALFLGMLSAGDHVALAQGLYGRTQVLIAKELTKFGVTFSLFDSTDVDSLESALTAATRLVFVETITNPLVRVPDLHAIARLCQSRNIKMAVDNTFAPVICQPIDAGADFVTHSATKMIAGHSDATMGALVGQKSAIDTIRPVSSTFGLSGNPFEAALTLRGMATLALRMQKACDNALEVARFLEEQPGVKQVHYPGLMSHPDRQRARVLFDQGCGTIVTIDLGSRDAANRLIQRLNGRIPFAPSLGDVATTLSHPVSTSHRGLTEAERLSLGITPGLVRLSFGIESARDIMADFRWALGYFHTTNGSS